jgi:adenylate cyclase
LADVVQDPIPAGAPTPPAADLPDQEITASFCFVDIAGYTALTDSHGERAAADLVDEFNGLIRSAVHMHGTVQELSGDNAFIVFPDPASALRSITMLCGSVAGLRHFPLLRIGLHHGQALLRSGRYFGSTINIAARTAAQARGGEILCTNAVVELVGAPEQAGVSVVPVGKIKLKNLPRKIDLYRIALAASAMPLAIDPVCQMQVDAQSAVSSCQFDGRWYWFCSSACQRRFAAAPSEFI